MEAAEAIFESIVGAGWDGVLRMKRERREESLHLEFKGKQNPSRAKSDKSDRRRLAEALSGFANADGGVLIFGMDAREGSDGLDAVQGVKPIKTAEVFRSELEGLLPDMVQPPVEGVRMKTIEDPEDSDQGVVVILVPRSEATPHMALGSGQAYYRRDSRSFVPMAHNEVADMFGRRPHPVADFEIEWSMVLEGRASHPNARLKIWLFFRNDGRAIARFPCLTLGEVAGWDLDRSAGGLPEVGRPRGSLFRVAGDVNTVAYPGDSISAATIIFRVTAPWDAGEPPPFELSVSATAEGAVEQTTTLMLTPGEMWQRAVEVAKEKGEVRGFGWG